jgi:hypothetical protein
VTRWEYVTVLAVAAWFEDAAGDDNYHSIVKEHGGLGWELNAVRSYTGQTVGGWIVVLFFKRPARWR